MADDFMQRIRVLFETMIFPGMDDNRIAEWLRLNLANDIDAIPDTIKFERVHQDGGTMVEARKRYMHDPTFHMAVDTLADYLAAENMNPETFFDLVKIRMKMLRDSTAEGHRG